MASTITVAPTHEPVSLTEAKKWLEIDDNRHDTTVAGLIVAAREYCEHRTGLKLISQTIEEVFDCFPYERIIELGFSPVSSVTSVKYRDTNGTYQTFASTNYDTDIVTDPPRVILNASASWPSVGDFYNAAKVTYVAGYADALNVPEAVRAAMKLLLAFWFENREDIAINGTSNYRVRSADALLSTVKSVNVLI